MEKSSGQNHGGRAKALELLGLAQRAGAVERGVDAARRAVREGRARLVLIAEDASAVQLKKIMGLLEHRTVPYRVAGGRAALGAAVGEAELSAVAVTKRDFAEPMLRHLPERGREGADDASGGQE
jgi:ribosomal protein L7Ae-like RNA K-turn-binding protein